MHVEACYTNPTFVCSSRSRGVVNVLSNTCPRYIGRDSYTVSSSLNTGSGAFRVDIRDDDPQHFGQVTFELLGDSAAVQDFTIDSLGQVRATSNFRQSGVSRYNLQVAVRDGATYNPCYIIVNIPVNVNRNRYKPRFSNSSAVISILEIHPVTDSILTLRATDQDDTAPHNSIRYELHNHNDQFFVDELTGRLYLRRSLYDSGIDQYVLTTNAKDLGTPLRTSDDYTITVNVLRNKFAPHFVGAPYTILVDRNSAVGGNVGAIVARDRDTVSPFNVFTLSENGDGVTPAYFGVRNNGAIFLKSSLIGAGSEYYLRVRASDGGIPSKANETVVRLVITGRDLECTPSFTDRLIEIFPVGQPFLIRNDTVPAGITWSIEPKQFFPTHTAYVYADDEGRVSLSQPLYNTDFQSLQFKLVAKDSGTDNVECTTDVTMVISRNNFAPTITPGQQTISRIDQNTRGCVWTIAAQDDDPEPQFGRPSLRFYMIGDPIASRYFRINEQTGAICIQNYGFLNDTTENYKVQVRVEDGGIPAKTGTGEVIVRVERNSFGPRFEANYTLTIPDSHIPGTLVQQIFARDDDVLPPFNSVRYYLEGNARAIEYFYVNDVDGQVILRKAVTAGDSFTLTIRGSDGGSPPLNGTVYMNINVVASQGTLLMPNYLITIDERQPVGEVITALQASPGSNIRYTTIGNAPGWQFFAVDRLTGNFSVSSSLMDDSLKRTTYEMRARATRPSDGQTADGTIRVVVLRNLNAPRFINLPYRNNISIDSNVNDVAFAGVEARDADGDQLIYTIQSQYFTIHPTTGIITVIRPLRDSQTDCIQSTVTVTDGSRTAEAPVTICLTGDNQRPYFVDEPYEKENLASTAANNSVVIRVEARDNDLQGTIVYETLDIGYGAQFFYVDRTGHVRVRDSRGLGADFGTVYTVLVSAHDSAFPQMKATSSVVIRVNRNPTAPQFSQDAYVFNITDRYFTGQEIGRVSATDVDGDSVTYSILQGNFQRYFVHGSTGVIYLIKSLLGTNLNQDSLVIQATDSGIPGRTRNASVLINIERDQGPPRFINEPYSATLTHDKPVNSLVVVTRAVDNDLVGELVYEIIGQVPAPSFFRLRGSDSGGILLNNDLRADTLETSPYLVTVIAYDSAYPDSRASATATINVNRNPNPPVGPENYVFNVSVSAPLGTVVLDIDATDLDNDTLTYTMITGTAGEATRYFYVDQLTGAIYIKRPLSPDAQDFTFQVRVSDNGSPSKSYITNIRGLVLRCPLHFDQSEYIVQADRNAPVGSTLSTVTVTGGRGVSYSLIASNPASQLFNISSTGAIQVRSSLASTSIDRLLFEVEASNSECAVRAPVAIILQNVNAPVIAGNFFNVTIDETTAPFSIILRINASDADNDDLTFTLTTTDGGNGGQYFSVDRNQALIRVSQLLTSDSPVVTYRMRLTASDGSNADTANVQINVRRDEFAPVWPRASYSVVVLENVTVGHVLPINNFNAFDGDLRGTIMYRVIGDEVAPVFFGLNDQNRLVTEQPLIFAPQNEYLVRVLAYDSHYPDSTAETEVTVNIIRLDISNTTTDVTISENTATFTEIHRVNEGAGGQRMAYTIQNSDEVFRKYFFLGADTGAIYVQRPLAGQNLSVATVKVKSCVAGSNTCGFESLTIRIVPGQAPLFINTPYIHEIGLSQAVNSTVLNVTAIDSDLQGRIEYRIVGIYPSQQFFRVEPDGRIVLIESLRDDNLRNTEYRVIVQAYDSAVPDQYAEETAVINVFNSAPTVNPRVVDLDLSEFQAPDVIYQIVAEDADGDSLTYQFVNIDGTANNFFWVHPTNGTIRLMRSFTTVPTNQFRLPVRICDTRSPPSCALPNFVLNVNVNRAGVPSFINLPAEITVSENRPVDSTIYTVSASGPDLVGDLVYGVVGNSPAPSYFDVGNDGKVKVLTDLTQDNTNDYQVSLIISHS